MVIPDVVAGSHATGRRSTATWTLFSTPTGSGPSLLETPAQLAAFAHHERQLVGPDGRNVGECGVLALTDDLLAGKYRLPFEPGGFAEWCAREGIF
ncbi:hypothetical protein ABZ023_21265 [Streptomyces sp. NPDC006367]|uniref:hypothetical protein n=1 Tax=unclassified Streptomyces TaxID=2593676 RepID=UPI0033AF87D6